MQLPTFFTGRPIRPRSELGRIVQKLVERSEVVHTEKRVIYG
jgi:hypothetical protein